MKRNSIALAALTLTMILLASPPVSALPPLQARVVLELVTSPGLMPAPTWSDYRILADGKLEKITYSGFGAQIASQTETLGMLSPIRYKAVPSNGGEIEVASRSGCHEFVMSNGQGYPIQAILDGVLALSRN